MPSHYMNPGRNKRLKPHVVKEMFVNTYTDIHVNMFTVCTISTKNVWNSNAQTVEVKNTGTLDTLIQFQFNIL